MKAVKLLDCTLRDGGYINNWNFGSKKIKSIIEKLQLSNIDIIECGFITGKDYNKEYSLYQNADDVNNLIESKPDNVMHVAMIAMGEKEIHPSLLCEKNNSYIDGIRLTFHESEIEKAFEYGKIIKEKGYKLFMQPVGTTLYTDKKLIDLIEKINVLDPYAFYLVDTLGTLYPTDILRFLYLIDNNLKDSIALGFHSHNNLQLSFSNAQKMLEFNTERQLIIDCSCFGMGRGAGNLCSEMICEYLNKEYDASYNIIPILEIIDEELMPIFVESPWGYSAGYYLSAINYCHPNYASYLLSKQTIPVRTISRLLNQLPQHERGIFNKSLMEGIYQKYQENFVDDRENLENLKKVINDREVLLIGPGPSTIEKKSEILEYIETNNPLVISINFFPKDIEPDLVFISNNKRYNKYIKNVNKSMIIATSNIKEADDTLLKVNYSDLLNSSNYVSDNAGLMLIKLLINLNVKNISIAGMDGFNKNLANNYVEEDMIGTIDSYQVEIKNAEMTKEINNFSKLANIHFITATKYELVRRKNEKD